MIYGADFSTLVDVEAHGGAFFADGHRVDPVEFMAECGITSARLKLWVNPYSPEGRRYGGGNSDFARTVALARRAKAAGMDFLLDLHYSDFWCDPSRQMIPKDWQGLRADTICRSLYDWTAETLTALDALNLSPSAVQVGNEITNGMLWPIAFLNRDPAAPEGTLEACYDRLAAFLTAGSKAVREASSARVMLHLENSGNTPLWTEWLDAITAREVPFDELGASYYPYWHGTMERMKENLSFCSVKYQKPVAIVETAYAFTGEHYRPDNAEGIGLAMTDNDRCWDGSPMPYPASPEGQADFLRALIRTAGEIPDCIGIWWWEPAWLPTDGSGWATKASLAYCGEEEKATGNEWANQCLFDYKGNALPAWKVFKE